MLKLMRVARLIGVGFLDKWWMVFDKWQRSLFVIALQYNLGRKWSATMTLLLIGLLSTISFAQVDFNTQVRPIFNRACLGCHGGVHQKNDLTLLYRKGLLENNKSGLPAIVPGKPAESELIRRISHHDKKVRMPLGQDALSQKEIDVLTQWIKEGAPFADHWAYLAPVKSELPKIADDTWCQNEIDYYIVDTLTSQGLTPSVVANKRTLLRRLCLDIIGVPPTAKMVSAFLNNQSEHAVEEIVDQLLDSDKYGEKWASMWLDLARYSDSQGYEKDSLRSIWPYRDWVIKAFNDDMPYDKFTIEQLAGDLLPSATQAQKIATGFHRNTLTNTEGGTDDEEFRVQAVIDRTNTTWLTWMGTSFSCVQCHSHPYDPFRHKEYYQFYDYFNQTQDTDSNADHPKIKVATGEAFVKQQTLNKEIKRLVTLFSHDTPSVKNDYKAWMDQLKAPVVWDDPIESNLITDKNVQYDQQADHSYLATGKVASNDVIRVMIKPTSKTISAIRLDVLPDASLPKKGVGRKSDGNFVLSDFSVNIIGVSDTPKAARYVRIDLKGSKKILSLAEVEVFAGEINIALNKAAKQSSIAYEGEASRAIDGNIDPEFKNDSVIHTQTSTDPFWEVDLASTHGITRVVLHNRNSFPQRLLGAKVTLLDDNRKVIYIDYIRDTSKLITEFEVAKNHRLPLVHARADFSQKDYDVSLALNHTNSAKQGWAVSPKTSKAHWAVFSLDHAMVLPENAQLEVVMRHDFNKPDFTIGRFKLSTTDAASLPLRTELPSKLYSRLSKDTPLTAQNIQAYKDFYKSKHVPAYKELNGKLTQKRLALKALKLPTTLVMADLAVDKHRDTKMFLRGNWQALGDQVSAKVPELLEAAMDPDWPKNRLGMAKWVVSPSNPLTSRVLVNRLWQQLFGRGIVETLEDFGSQGTLPSHPKLLDYMALKFQGEYAYSVKAMIKEIVCSATYQQRSISTDTHLAKDPRNIYLAHAPRVRLTAEQVRDQALAVCGLMSDKMYGPGVMPYQPDGIWSVIYSGRQWVTSSGEDQYRRGVYTLLRRSAPYPSMMTFDGTDRSICLPRRLVTNTPLQALVTLNDPVYIECAQTLASSVISDQVDAPIKETVNTMFQQVLMRQPSEREVEAITALYDGEYDYYQSHPSDAKLFIGSKKNDNDVVVEVARYAAWTSVANVVLNLDETLTRE